jgi:hypothetical protein
VRRNRPAAAVLAGLVALLAACSLPGEAKTFQSGPYTVVDEAGLVTDLGQGAPPSASDERPVVESPGSLTELAVYWSGSSCAQWTIRLSGNALRLTIEPSGGAEACPDGEHAVTIRLNRVVEVEGIEVEQRESSWPWRPIAVAVIASAGGGA